MIHNLLQEVYLDELLLTFYRCENGARGKYLPSSNSTNDINAHRASNL